MLFPPHFLYNLVICQFPFTSQLSLIIWQLPVVWRLTRGSSETHEDSRLHLLLCCSCCVTMQRKALYALFHIHELMIAHDWLLLLWVTGEREYAIPPSQRTCPNLLSRLPAMDGCGIVKSRTRNLLTIRHMSHGSPQSQCFYILLKEVLRYTITGTLMHPWWVYKKKIGYEKECFYLILLQKIL